jgi:hypothetical protein
LHARKQPHIAQAFVPEYFQAAQTKCILLRKQLFDTRKRLQEFLGMTEALAFALGSECASFAATAGIITVIVVMPIAILVWLLSR